MRITDAKQLKLMANTLRQDIIQMLLQAKSGHPAGALGLADVFAVLYFNVLNHDPKKPDWPGRDRFVLSNGHVCPVLYSALANAGYFPHQELLTLRKLGSPLQGHPHRGSLPGLETSSGPLGQGLSQAVGMAIVSKAENAPWNVYAVLSDGEHNEGQIWEAMLLAAKYKLDNLVVLIDRNFIQIDGTTEDVLPLDPFAEKYKAFGWHVLEIDGNDIQAILDACNSAKKLKGKPITIICRIVPGKGVSFMENNCAWHGKPPKKEDAEKALKELKEERARLEVM